MCQTVFNKYEFGSFMQLTNERETNLRPMNGSIKLRD